MRNVSLSRFSLCFYVISRISIFLEDVCASNVKTHVRLPRQAPNCNGFKCTTTGECLDSDKRCDGIVDCKDGSDEFDDCKDAVKCPGYLFKCDYGACIEESKKCNEQKDCRDNSDEINCILTNNVNKVSSNCKSDQFECKSGQCIPRDVKCDGKTDCDDRSDETKLACLNMQCPGWTFKCDYGACVDGDARCNNVTNCVDNSDEEGCQAPPVIPTPTPTPVVPDVTQAPPPGGCTLPDHPQFGQWSILGGAAGNPSQKVPVSSVIMFSCNNGYKVSSNSEYVVCDGNAWSTNPMPTCLRKCKPFYSTKYTTINCFDSKKNVIKCDEATSGAKAEYECAPYFEPSERTYSPRYCFDGTWNLPEPVCQPVCGEKKVSAEPLIVNGQVVQKGDYPWVTAIFQRLADGSFLNVCGGSMLTQKIILTAAHCVSNNNGNALDKELIMVAVGKYYNKYQDTRDREAQYSKIDKIYIPDKYKADKQRFASDIALLITTDILLLSKVVQPVCYLNVVSIHLDPSTIGVITGWGYTLASDKPSEELREISVPYKPDSECLSELPTDWSDKYYTYDKMCAGYYNKSTAVCKGDSGGGLVFKYEKRFYVHGIVSVGHTLTKGCNIEVSSLYTKVSSHYQWLEQIIAQNQVW